MWMLLTPQITVPNNEMGLSETLIFFFPGHRMGAGVYRELKPHREKQLTGENS